jgi:3-oxoacyl-[acyl-carrier protein] reductase
VTTHDPASRRELSGKVALVTGGARNIGRAIARALASGGADVMVSALHAHADVDETVREIEAAGSRGASHIADVTIPMRVARWSCDRCPLRPARHSRQQRGDPAGAAVRRHVVRRMAKRARGDSRWRVPLRAACVPHLARSGDGSIVNIGGETGHRGAAGRAHVVAAKAGLAGFTKALALDLAPQRITVNCVVPGRIDTVRAAGEPGSARSSPRCSADRPSRPAGRGGGDGAHAVRPGRALHHGASRSTSMAARICHEPRMNRHDRRAALLFLLAFAASARRQDLPRLRRRAVSAAAAPAGQGRHVAADARAMVERMLTMAKTTSADVVYDLGSGDGRLPIAAAQKFGAKARRHRIRPRPRRAGAAQRGASRRRRQGDDRRRRHLQGRLHARDRADALPLPDLNQQLRRKSSR